MELYLHLFISVYGVVFSKVKVQIGLTAVGGKRKLLTLQLIISLSLGCKATFGTRWTRLVSVKSHVPDPRRICTEACVGSGASLEAVATYKSPPSTVGEVNLFSPVVQPVVNSLS